MSTPYLTAEDPSGARINLPGTRSVANTTTSARDSLTEATHWPRDLRDGSFVGAAGRPLMPLGQAFISAAKCRTTTAELSRPGSTEHSTKGGISHDQQSNNH